jgi:DNA-directed RNA polymerase specialized sigma24 family protein
VHFQPGRREVRRDVWFQERGEDKLRTFLDAVTQLKSTERFVFVMTVLEGYSVKETALLLDRTPESVHNLRIEALQRLAELNPGNDRDSSSSGALRNCNRELRLKREIKHEDCLAWAQRS